MNRTIITILFTLVAIAGRAEIHYRLEGDIGKPDFTGVMEICDIMKLTCIDTIKVVNGIIEPKEGILPEMAMCVLADTTSVLVQTDSVPEIVPKLSLYYLFIDNGTTRVMGLKNNWLQQSGTPISDEIVRFNQRIAEIQKNNSESEPERAIQELLYDIIYRHTGDVYGINLLINEGRWYLDAKKWIELYDRLMQDNGEYINKLPHMANDLKHTYEKMKARPMTDVGSMFVDFSIEYEGKITRLSDYVGRGKYVLADFWASWCGPCIAAFPMMKQLHKSYANRGLRIIGISLDEEGVSWRKAIEKHYLPWVQLRETVASKSNKSAASNLYGIAGVPTLVLIDPNGKIISSDLNIKDLKVKLEEIFNENK